MGKSIPKSKDFRLSDIQEVAITLIIEKEILMLREICELCRDVDIDQAFYLVASDKSNVITLDKIRRFLKMHGRQMDNRDVICILRRMDLSGDATITKKEWRLFFAAAIKYHG